MTYLHARRLMGSRRCRKFGRLSKPDDRDGKFPIAKLLPRRRSSRTSRYWYANGWSGDQKNTARCVAFAWLHWLEDGPVTHNLVPAPMIAPGHLYTEAQRVDEWDGEDYEGTSVRAGAKVLKRLGYVAEYRWAWQVESLIGAVLELGPVVVGTLWSSGMDDPDKHDVIRFQGVEHGGHAYVINGVNLNTGLFRLKNSWGTSWGRNGRAFISFEDMDRLMALDGEVCLAVEVPSRK